MSDDDVADPSEDGYQVIIILVHVVIVFVGAALLGWLYWQNADLRTRFELLTTYRKWTGSIFGGRAQYDMVSVVTAQGCDVATTRPTVKSGGTARANRPAGRSTKPGFASFKGRSREIELERAERWSSDSSGVGSPREPPEHKHGATTKKAASKATSGSKRMSSPSAAAKSSATATRASKGSSKHGPARQ